MKLFKIICIVFLGISFFMSCSDDDNGQPQTNGSKDFVWKAMNLWYFYQEEVSDLADNRFANQAELDDYLANFDSPATLFEALKNEPTDRFSSIYSDYGVLQDAFNGTSTSFGYEYTLTTYETNSNNVFGFVQYVVPNSPADLAGVTRGQLFNRVNGQQITRNNFANLLFGNDNYTLGFADYDNGNLTDNGIMASLNATELTENPILLNTVIQEGSLKIGYLVYNSFVRSFDDELNAAMGQLAAQGVDELVLDLRHNGGGSVSSAQYLGSMITGQFANQPFVELKFNNKREGFNRTYDFVNSTADGLNLNQLGLDHVYVLLSGSSASASELIVNSLKPYIDVTVIGTTSVGKNVGQIPLYDSPGSDFTNVDGADNAHRWALLPITFSYFNSVGNNDFGSGIVPDIQVDEFDFLGDIKPLGDTNEALLAAAIAHMTGNQSGMSVSTSARSSVSREILTNANAKKLLGNNMYLER